ncbi:MAG: hypothetical protein IPO66_21480 [Rhodanobacteraceae bacterium]|nr:hypothetical protein [Rhodanobacteraceae bacterium]
MKSMFRCVVLVLLVTMGLSACVTAPKSQAFNREANATLKRIQILPLQVKPVELVMFNNPANSFGLIGAVIAESGREQGKMAAESFGGGEIRASHPISREIRGSDA